MVDYYDPLAVSAIGGNALSSTNNPRLGLYSPVNISQHATSPANAANIAKVGFQPGFPGWAGANKIYSSSDPNVLKHYGTSKIGMITPEGNRLPWGGGISKRGVTLSTAGESAVGIEKANKAREFYERLMSGKYDNSPTAQRLLTTGKNYAGGLGNWLSKFSNVGSFMRRVPQAGFVSDALFGTNTQGSFARDINQALNVPLKKDGTVQRNIKDYRASQGSNVNQGGGNQGGGGRAAIAGGAAGASTPSRPSGYDAVRKYGRARGGLASLWPR